MKGRCGFDVSDNFWLKNWCKNANFNLVKQVSEIVLLQICVKDLKVTLQNCKENLIIEKQLISLEKYDQILTFAYIKQIDFESLQKLQNAFVIQMTSFVLNFRLIVLTRDSVNLKKTSFHLRSLDKA
jgi:hypothetical protein